MASDKNTRGTIAVARMRPTVRTGWRKGTADRPRGGGIPTAHVTGVVVELAENEAREHGAKPGLFVYYPPEGSKANEQLQTLGDALPLPDDGRIDAPSRHGRGGWLEHFQTGHLSDIRS